MSNYVSLIFDNNMPLSDTPAVIDMNGQRATSWKTLYKQSCRVAAYAVSCGLKGVVPVFMPRCVETVEVLLGLGLAGIGIAPLSEHTPAARVALIEEQTGNTAWTQAQYEKAVANECDGFAPVDFADDEPAYIVFTSGSTGQPKGVMLSSKCIERTCIRDAGEGFLEMRKGDISLQSSSFSFVALLINLFAPLYGGCVNHILPEEARTDAALMTEYINKYRINKMALTVKVFARLGSVPSLEVVCLGGERVMNIGPKGYKVKNVWGMSETGGPALTYDVPAPMQSTPIGTGNDDFRCYILDEQGKPAQEGELCVSGAISLGYYKLPDLTAAAYEPNRFCDDAGHEILMHTGDIVRMQDDGNMLYLNRKDFMIKINGQRVEPGEAEAVIGRINGIKAVVVKGFTEDDGHSYLCAYYVSDEPIDEDKIRAELEGQLPDYSIPSFYVRLDALPLNVNGKVDRMALAAPAMSQIQGEYAAPANDAEASLCRAFAKVLGLERIGANDDFFRLGGDSILAMSIVNSAGIEGLSTADVFVGRTPRHIAELAVKHSEEKFATDKKERALLTDSQMGIYLACASAPGSIKYNVTFSISLDRKEGMTCESVKSAVDSVISAHPALYSRVSADGENIYMYRCPMPEGGICEAVESEKAFDEGEWDQFVRAFELDVSPICRAKAILTSDKVYILMDSHHIVSDGTSVTIIVKQICDALTGSAPEAETADAFNVYDIRRRIDAENAEKAREHYAALLGGIDVDSNLFPDHAGNDIDPVAERVEFTIGDIDFSLLRGRGITASTFFMSVFGYTLAKMTGQSESLFAVAENGRKRRKSALFNNTVSMMVRTLPVYMKIDEKQSAADIMSVLQKQFYDSINYDGVPFAQLCEEYGITSDVMFVYQSDMFSGINTAADHAEVEIRPTGRAISNFNASVFKCGGSHRVVLEYRGDRYDRATIERFAEVFRASAAAFAADKPLSGIRLLGDDDKAFLDGLNHTERTYRSDDTIVDIFRRRARQNPDKTAVICEERSYSYKQVDEISDRLAAYVHSLGIGKGQTVSVLIPRCEYMPIASIGIMKAGAVYQPLDPSYPADRLAFMCEDASSALLIADRALLSMLPGYSGKILCTDEIPSLPAETLECEPPRPEDVFVLLYTSGTTGKPKGCMLMHSNLIAFLHAYTRLTEMNTDSIVAAYASYGFDAHMADMYPAIACGCTLIIVPDSIRLDLQAVKDYCESNHVSHLLLTTQLCVQFVLQYKELKYLKCMLSGGEKMVSLEPPMSYKLINAYGPTECTVMETYFTVDKVYDDIPIGSAIDNTKLYVVDSFGRRVPVGVPGELIIAGPQVALGYLNRPEQTAKAFVPNTFDENVVPEYSRCYRTGDIVRFLPSGDLAFIGRRDMQVKIRGFRIELSEVEKVILDFPAVKSATVVACDSPAGGKCLHAYVVGDEKIDIEQLNAHIRAVKPAYMVPAATMQIDSLPLTVNGKVDKRKLPKIEVEYGDVTKPETETQQIIFDKAAQVIGAEGFGINTDLFEAGLSSIGSIRLCSLLATEFGIHVQIRNLKKYPTVAKLEEFVHISLGKTAPAAKVAVSERYSPDHPISKTMEGIFTECMSRPDSTFYNIPYLLKLAPSIDAARLKIALAAAVEAHPYMKAELYTDADGGIRQHIRLDDTFTPNMIADVNAESIDEIKLKLVKPFTLTGGRLFEVSLIHADGLYLFLDFHHIIADGTSIGIFLEDVQRAYGGAKLTIEEYSGFDAADDEQVARTEEDIAAAKEYYGSMLDGLDRNFLPLSDVYPHSKRSSGHLVMSSECSGADTVREFCARHRVSENAFFVSAFGFTLSRYAASDYSVFTTIYNGRNDSRCAGTFAMLVKTLPVVFHADKDNSTDAVSEMSSQLMDSMANDLYSFSEIARAFDVNTDVMFIYQGSGFAHDSFCGAPAEEIGLSLSDAKTPFALQVMIKDGRIIYDLDYDPERFSEKLMRAFLSAFDMACAGFANGKKLAEIGLLSEKAEKEIKAYNDTEYAYDRSRTITDMFLESAQKHPDRICVAFRDTRLTFAQANELSGKTALFLMRNGIGRGDVVPILINRDENMVITAHGAVRAGAAYLGLDPTYPADRLEFMIKDCGAKYIIAERDLMDKIPGYTGDVLYTDEIASLEPMSASLETEFRAQPKHMITPENDALVVYSSGTTGLPKGSVLQHKAVVCFYHNYSRCCAINENANVATYASFGFDGGAMDVFCAPMAGASLFVIPDDIRLDIAALEMFFERNSITTGFMTTQVGTMFIAGTKCKTLRHFIVGGEKFIPVLAPEWIDFMNGYGPSETMCYVNRYHITDDGSLQPIGVVSSNTKEYIIDRFGNRLPFGACGEMCISGGQMSRGYLNRPDKTAQAFVKNPFSCDEDYAKMYRTGDIVRMLPDGNYDFVGRRDGQVKIRGFRVELSEIEMQIRKFPDIEKAVVTAFDNPSGGKFLAAYIVAPKPISVSELKSFILAEKPAYMVPAAITQIDEIPLTSNGKTDIKKLPRPEMRDEHTGAEPANATEKKICDIFADVLGLSKVYADDDFFEIGGTSISAIKVTVKCEKAGMNVVYKNLFANPTAQQLAVFLAEGQKHDVSASDLEKGDGHNYSALKYNIVDNLPYIKNNGIGKVLLTGVTGFLGSHLLRELLDTTSEDVICLVRSKGGMSAADRLEMIMVYYFEDWYTPEKSQRITVIDGDLEDSKIRNSLSGVNFDTIINSAANVKHFAAGDELMGSNFTGVENLLSLAEEKNAKLIQISSLSVCGESVNGSIPAGYKFRETDLNIGQSLENKYLYTKYLAEQAVIDAISNGRIRGKIIRLGNLQARAGDSEFQINAATNGFLRFFISIAALGCFPVGLMDSEIEFSPIDAVAKAVLLLSGTPDGFTVFHAKNCNTFHYGYLLSSISQRVKHIDIVEDHVFNARLNKALEDSSRVESLGGLLAYSNGTDVALTDEHRFYSKSDTGRNLRFRLGSDTTFTTKALYRLGFAWPLISQEYLDKLVDSLAELNVFGNN